MTDEERLADQLARGVNPYEAIKAGLGMARDKGFTKDGDIALTVIAAIESAGFHIVRMPRKRNS